MDKGRETWRKPRHAVARRLAAPIIGAYTRLRYGVTVEPYKTDGQALILFNHQTALDQFLVGLAFSQPVYYVASEDLFSAGLPSAIMRYLVAPIPIKKQTTDIRAVKNCIRVAREGGTIAIAPEGNRTYSGRLCHMNPAIAPLARKLGLPILLFRIEGGYGVHPRWSDAVRRGKMRAYVAEVISPEEARAMDNATLLARIRAGIDVDEEVCDRAYRHRRLAEYLERVFYVCPGCGLSRFASRGDTVRCLRCGQGARYLPSREFAGLAGAFPYRFVGDWYAAQEAYINRLDTREYTETPLFRDRGTLLKVIPYKRKKTLRRRAELALYGDRIVVDEGTERELRLPFSELSVVTVLGRNKVNLYHGEELLQLKGDKRFNGLKYVHIFYRNQNIQRGDSDAKFLGL